MISTLSEARTAAQLKANRLGEEVCITWYSNSQRYSIPLERKCVVGKDDVVEYVQPKEEVNG